MIELFHCYTYQSRTQHCDNNNSLSTTLLLHYKVMHLLHMHQKHHKLQNKYLYLDQLYHIPKHMHLHYHMHLRPTYVHTHFWALNLLHLYNHHLHHTPSPKTHNYKHIFFTTMHISNALNSKRTLHNILSLHDMQTTCTNLYTHSTSMLCHNCYNNLPRTTKLVAFNSPQNLL